MITDARFTFISKFLNKRNKRRLQDKKEEDNSEILNNIIKIIDSDNIASTSTSTSISINDISISKHQLWQEFLKWGDFDKDSVKTFKNHCKNIWNNIQNA